MDILNRLIKLLGLALFISLALLLSGCTATGGRYGGSDGAPPGDFDASKIPDAVPKPEARSRYGNSPNYVVAGKRYHVLSSAQGYSKVGYASWYGTKFHGQHTSSREPYNMFSMTAASTTLPIPTYVRVTNLENNRSAIVKVNDRGPFKSNRIIDLSYAAAKKLGYADNGTTLVRVTAIDTDSKNTFFASNDHATSIPAAISDRSDIHSSSHHHQKSISAQHTQLAVNNGNTLYLQIGAFKTRSKAVNLSRQISALTQADVSVKESYRHNHTIYRVHIGPLANNTQTDKIKSLLQQHGFEKPIAVTG